MLDFSAKKAEILIIWSGFVGRPLVAIPLKFCSLWYLLLLSLKGMACGATIGFDVHVKKAW
ncbi:hypothetical protein DsansV1_C13g0119921 [Dioscorea sansibarensis]